MSPHPRDSLNTTGVMLAPHLYQSSVSGTYWSIGNPDLRSFHNATLWPAGVCGRSNFGFRHRLRRSSLSDIVQCMCILEAKRIWTRPQHSTSNPELRLAANWGASAQTDSPSYVANDPGRQYQRSLSIA